MFEGEVAEWLKTQGYNEIKPNIRVTVKPGFQFECDVHAHSYSLLWIRLRRMGIVLYLIAAVALVIQSAISTFDLHLTQYALVSAATVGFIVGMFGKKRTGHHAWVECKSYKVNRSHVMWLASVTDDLDKYKQADWRPRYVMLFSAVGFDSGALSYALEKKIDCYQQTENGFVLVQGGAPRSGTIRNVSIATVIAKLAASFPSPLGGVSNKALLVALVAAVIALISVVVSFMPQRPVPEATQELGVKVPAPAATGTVETKAVRDSRRGYSLAQASSSTPASAPEAVSTPYPVSASLRPTITYKEKPRYTEEARIQEIQGTVVLEVVFNANGTITEIRPIRGLPYGLTESAIDAAQKLTFLPARKDGAAVSVRGLLEFSFEHY